MAYEITFVMVVHTVVVEADNVQEALAKAKEELKLKTLGNIKLCSTCNNIGNPCHPYPITVYVDGDWLPEEGWLLD